MLSKNKKISIAVLMVAGFLLVNASIAMSATWADCAPGQTLDEASKECRNVTLGGDNSAFKEVESSFTEITNFLKYFYGAILAISMVFIILGGLKYVTASGDPEKAAVGKKQILYGVIGIAIILGVWVIVLLIANLIGVDTANMVNPFQ